MPLAVCRNIFVGMKPAITKQNRPALFMGAVLLILAIFGGCSKEKLTPGLQKITLETDFGSAFELQIALPTTYSPSKSYGLILLLDAEWLMKETVEALEKTGFAADYIVAGLAYSGTNNRANDFTPTESAPGSGKAPFLADFIETEIIQQYLHQHFPNLIMDRHKRVFIGYSLGGLFGTWLFLKQKELFGQYLLISSAYMTDAQSVFGIEQDERSSARFQQTRMYFATGSLEEGGFHATVQHFNQILSDHYPNVTYKSEVVRNAGHTGVRIKALRDGLAYLLQ